MARLSAGRPARLAVGVVSAGRVGAVVGAALAAAGHRVVATSGVSRASVQPGRGAAARRPAAARRTRSPRRADLVLLAVPDDVLPGLVRGLAAAGCFRPGQIVVHTSGAHGVAVLAPAAEHGVLPLALHPVMTFTGRTEDVARLAGAQRRGDRDRPTTRRPGASARRSSSRWAPSRSGCRRRSARSTTPRSRTAPTTWSRWCATASTLLERAGIQPAERLVAPLLSAALDNALRHGDRALTGPVARGDAGTVRTHLRELDRRRPRRWPPTYRALAARTARRARGGRPAARARRGRGAATCDRDLEDATASRDAPHDTQERRGHRGTPGELTVHTDPAELRRGHPRAARRRPADRAWCRRWARCTRATAS